MGRHLKNIPTAEGRDRRGPGFYATPGFIAKFMTEAMLEIQPGGACVLDPAAGKEDLLRCFHSAGKSVDSFDIIDYGDHACSNFRRVDFLDYYCGLRQEARGGRDIGCVYDYYIVNPPYNCHEVGYIRDNKDKLNANFDDIGTHNMYSMFLGALIDCAKEGALIGMITLDSFLTARAHRGLRKKILDRCSVHYLVLCPSDLFRDQKADVRTCIIILQKGTRYQGSVKVGKRPRDTDRLKELLSNKAFAEKPIDEISLKTGDGPPEFVIDCPQAVRELFDGPRLGGLFPCITGISTGNDAKYISKEKTGRFTVPFYKNPGTRRFFTGPDGYIPHDFLDIHAKVKNFIVRNRAHVFKEGIICSSMGVAFGACYLPPESAFGVNAAVICGREDLWWLLGYLNSSLVTYIVRSCLIRSNMITSGYVARVPVPAFDAGARRRLSRIAREAYEQKGDRGCAGKYIDAIDELMYAYLAMDERDVREIASFAANLLKAV